MGKDGLQVTMDEFLPLRDVVFNTLRKAILTGELKPGERLMEIHLAVPPYAKQSVNWNWKDW